MFYLPWSGALNWVDQANSSRCTPFQNLRWVFSSLALPLIILKWSHCCNAKDRLVRLKFIYFNIVLLYQILLKYFLSWENPSNPIVEDICGMSKIPIIWIMATLDKYRWKSGIDLISVCICNRTFRTNCVNVPIRVGTLPYWLKYFKYIYSIYFYGSEVISYFDVYVHMLQSLRAAIAPKFSDSRPQDFFCISPRCRNGANKSYQAMYILLDINKILGSPVTSSILIMLIASLFFFFMSSLIISKNTDLGCID